MPKAATGNPRVLKRCRACGVVAEHRTRWSARRMKYETREACQPCRRAKDKRTPRRRHPLENAYSNMHRRVRDNPVYEHVSVCARWSGRDGFANFVEDMGPRPEGLTLDRIDSAGNYEPGNCRWADYVTQNRNRRNVVTIEAFGETRTLHEWCEFFQVDRSLVYSRIVRGWAGEKALTKKKT